MTGIIFSILIVIAVLMTVKNLKNKKEEADWQDKSRSVDPGELCASCSFCLCEVCCRCIFALCDT